MEPYLEGSFIKYSNNAGYVNTEDYRATLQVGNACRRDWSAPCASDTPNLPLRSRSCVMVGNWVAHAVYTTARTPLPGLPSSRACTSRACLASPDGFPALACAGDCQTPRPELCARTALSLPQAFTHWTHHATGGRLMVTDLQAGAQLYQAVAAATTAPHVS